jgi:hypothetical protein
VTAPLLLVEDALSRLRTGEITKMAKNKLLGTGDQPEAGVSFTIASTSSTFSTTVTTGTDGTVCTRQPGAGQLHGHRDGAQRLQGRQHQPADGERGERLDL